MSELIPPDMERCQAEIHTPPNPFAMGGSQRKVERCAHKALYLISEKELGKDGLKGQMTVCEEHLDIYKRKNAYYKDKVAIEPISQIQPLPTKPKIDGGIITDAEGKPVAVIDNIPADNNKTWDAE